MNYPVLTYLIAVLIVGAILDIYLVWKGGIKNTISWFVIQMSYKYPLIPLSCGILFGHFFWQLGCPGDTPFTFYRSQEPLKELVRFQCSDGSIYHNGKKIAQLKEIAGDLCKMKIVQ